MFCKTNQTNLSLLFGVMRFVFLPGVSSTKAKRLTVLSDFIPCHLLSPWGLYPVTVSWFIHTCDLIRDCDCECDCDCYCDSCLLGIIEPNGNRSCVINLQCEKTLKAFPGPCIKQEQLSISKLNLKEPDFKSCFSLLFNLSCKKFMSLS